MRQDNLLSEFKNTPDPNKYGKHRSCYAVYTNLKKFSKSQNDQPKKRVSSRDVLVSGRVDYMIKMSFINGSFIYFVKEEWIFLFIPIIYTCLTLEPDECLVCRKKKTRKGGSGYENLQKCFTFASATCLLNYANDDDYLCCSEACCFI